MPNPIKYSTSAQTLALKKGNFWIGTGDVGKGPTPTTDYYNGITPPAGGYTIYLNKSSGGPSIYTAANDTQLISLSNTIAGQTFATAASALDWYSSQTDKMVLNIDYPAVITNGLVMNLDAGFTTSYPTIGTAWYDLSSSGNNGALTNGPTFSSGNGGSLVFDGVDDSVQLGKTAAQLGFANASFSVSIWFNSSNTGSDSPLFSTNGGGVNTWLHYNLRSGSLHMGFYANDTPNGGIVSNNTTYCATFVYDISGTGTQSIYKNEILGNSTTGHSALQSNATFQIGGTYNTNYVGKIYQVIAYNRALTSEEVAQNFNATKTRFGL